MRDWKALLLAQTGGEIARTETIQSLWGGYGELVRVFLAGASVPSVVVKHIRFERPDKHPRGWASEFGHQRKLRSYEVEETWYQTYANLCPESCRIARCLDAHLNDQECLIILEDLNASGFGKRRERAGIGSLFPCIRWLAEFHAHCLGNPGKGLWERGSYWHLATRPDELEALEDVRLKAVAHEIDARLAATTFKTLIHGDAKLANFCFRPDDTEVAAVDFQYVGPGCGMQDLAYLVGSSFSSAECERLETRILNEYFNGLEIALTRNRRQALVSELRAEWEPLYPLAWADFHRFLMGWNPRSWKVHRYSETITRRVVDSLIDGVKA